MIVGIDLGTTNSAIAVWRDGVAQLIPNALGHVLTPSAISIGDGGEILVGLPARERLITHPARSASVFKRYMGADKVFTLGATDYRPEELSAFVLRALKSDAERVLGEKVTDAIITVPAYFNDLQRKATQSAGTLAGFNVKRLLSEPTAAALAYGLEAGDDEQTILVVDIGGGTFDVTVLHCFEGLMEVRATAGDTWLGGEDFVDAIVAAFMFEVGEAAGIPPVSQLAAVHGNLRRQAELAKRRLSEAQEATIQVAHNGKEIVWSLSRAKFEQISEGLLARVRVPIERALRDARLHPETISNVILAGGASRMPMFRHLIGRLFKRLPLSNINPDEVVARGAAVRAGMLARDVKLEEFILTDVTPFTLGIEVSHRPAKGGARIDGIYLPIIERNTVIPCSRVQHVFNMEDRQSKIDIRVYQGESRLVRDNILLGKTEVRFPPAKAGEAKIDVRFTYDNSGLLEVETLVAATGVRSTLVIAGSASALSEEEIAARLAKLAALKTLPSEDAENQALLAKANRMFAETLGENRAHIGAMLDKFRAALEGQDPMQIRLAAAQLSALLAQFDDEFFL
jgi:molecular chaperone HscC